MGIECGGSAKEPKLIFGTIRLQLCDVIIGKVE
jgi:hypothetical protein